MRLCVCASVRLVFRHSHVVGEASDHSSCHACFRPVSRVRGTTIIRVRAHHAAVGGSRCGVSRLGLRDCRGSQPERCWCGETGKRGALTQLWAQALVGSSPTTSTPDAGPAIDSAAVSRDLARCVRAPRSAPFATLLKAGGVTLRLSHFSELRETDPCSGSPAGTRPSQGSVSRRL
jgi:hypothetical protein